jgi:hypothetical protein
MGLKPCLVVIIGIIIRHVHCCAWLTWSGRGDTQVRARDLGSLTPTEAVIGSRWREEDRWHTTPPTAARLPPPIRHRAPQQHAGHLIQAPLDRATISTVMVPAKL